MEHFYYEFTKTALGAFNYTRNLLDDHSGDMSGGADIVGILELGFGTAIEHFYWVGVSYEASKFTPPSVSYSQ
jgi:hypothetical protein